MWGWCLGLCFPSRPFVGVESPLKSGISWWNTQTRAAWPSASSGIADSGLCQWQNSQSFQPIARHRQVFPRCGNFSRNTSSIHFKKSNDGKGRARVHRTQINRNSQFVQPFKPSAKSIPGNHYERQNFNPHRGLRHGAANAEYAHHFVGGHLRYGAGYAFVC